MEILFYYILCVWGLTHLLVSGKIFESTRNWMQIKIPIIGELLNCYQCTSFWCSMGIYFMFEGLEDLSFSFVVMKLNINFNFLIYSIIGSGIVPFLSLFFNRLIRKK